MMDGIYDDLEETEVTVEFDKIRTKNQILEDEITQLKEDLQGTKKKCGVLEKENEQLKNNISTLFKTAQGEIVRKDFYINDLRTELENLKFRRLGLQNKQAMHQNPILKPNRYNPKVNHKTDSIAKPLPGIKKLLNPILIEPKRETEEQQTSSVSGYNETMIKIKQEPDENLQPASPSFPSTEEQTAEVKPEYLHGNIVPKLENDPTTQLKLSYDAVETENLATLELNIKQEFIEYRSNTEVRENTDQKRKRYSPSPVRKISKRNTPDLYAGRNTHKLVSKSRSRERNKSQERQTRSPHNTRRFNRNDNQLIENTSRDYRRDVQDRHSRNIERHPHKKQIYSKYSDYNNDLRYNNNRRRNYE